MSGELETVDLERIPVFAAGGPYHGTGSPPEGDTYTADDVARIAADTQLAINGDALRARLKIGHSKQQKLLANSGLLDEDELPAIGWQTNFRTEDGVVYSDWKKVPAKLAAQIKAGRWRGRSVELSKKVVDGAEKLVISATSILGAKAPAVSTLDDIVALHGDADVPVRAFGYEAPIDLDDDLVAELADDSMTQALADSYTPNAPTTSGLTVPGVEECTDDAGKPGFQGVGHNVCRTHDGTPDGQKQAKIAAMKDSMGAHSAYGYADAEADLLRAFIETTDAAWDGGAGNWPDADSYCGDCLIDENPSGQPKSKSNCYLPYRRDGKVYTKALAAIASVLGGGRGGLKGPSDASIAKAKTRLASLKAAAGVGGGDTKMTDDSRADSFNVPQDNDTQSAAGSTLTDEQVTALAAAFAIEETDPDKRRDAVLAKFAEHAPKETSEPSPDEPAPPAPPAPDDGDAAKFGDGKGFTLVTDALRSELTETRERLAATERAYAERDAAEKKVRIDEKVKTAIQEARLHPSKQDEWRAFLDKDEETMTVVLGQLPVDETLKRAYGVDAGGSIVQPDGDSDEERLYAQSMSMMFPEITIVKREAA